jgi:hypothetical protein
MTVKTGQQLTTTSAAELPAVAFVAGPVTLKAPKGNAETIEVGVVGETAGNGFILDPGDIIQLPVANLGSLYVIGANTSDKITWIGA